MLAGAPVTASYFRDANSGTAQMADCLDPSISSLYGVSRLNSTTARVYAISNIGGTPSLNFTNVAIPSAPAPSAAAPSTPGDLDPLDGRIFSATWRSGHLFASHTVGLSGGVNAVRWYDVNLNSYPVGTPTLAQSGNVTPPAGPHYHMGAIAANGYNDVSTIFTRSASSGAGAPADAMAAGRKSSDPAGSMGTPILLSTSQGPSYGGVGDNRWGDYFAAGVDPTDDATFWGVAMVANASGGWITVVNSWTVTPPAVLDSHAVPPTISGGSTGVGTVNLDTPAPQFGYVVSLTSANPGVASVPATVTVPGGATSANYTITTSAVTSSTPVQITASLRGVNKPATTTVVPAGQLSGTVTLGGFTVSPAGRQVTIEIRNVGSTSPLQTAVVTLDGSGHFAMATSLVGTFDVAVKSSHWLRKRVANVTFTAAGASGVNATLTNGDVNGDNTVSLGDFQQLRTAFGSVPASSNWNAEADLNGDGTVSIADFQILRTNFGAIGDN
jgi:hypothetical protein